MIFPDFHKNLYDKGVRSTILNFSFMPDPNWTVSQPAST